MQAVALSAIDEYIARRAHKAKVAAALTRVVREEAGVLERLRARAAAAPAGSSWRAPAARQPAPAPSGGRDLGDDDFRYPPTRAPRSAAGPERTGARLGKLGLALLGSRAARQAARWAWQGTRAVRSDAAARLGARATGMGGAMQWVQRANAWRERHALAKARRELDQDLRQLRRAARRR